MMKDNPTIACALNEWISVGAGFSFAVARMTFKSQLNNSPSPNDGSMTFESWDEAFAGNIGVILKPIPPPKLRVGLAYQSPEYFGFGFNPHFENLGRKFAPSVSQIGTVKINIPVKQPQQVMLSALYQVVPRWSLMGNVSWQNWSAFGQFPVGISAANQHTVQAKSTFLRYLPDHNQAAIPHCRKMVRSAGFAYDSSPVSQANRSAVLPIDRQLRYGAGLQYEIDEALTAGAAWELLDAGPAPFSNTRGPSSELSRAITQPTTLISLLSISIGSLSGVRAAKKVIWNFIKVR